MISPENASYAPETALSRFYPFRFQVRIASEEEGTSPFTLLIDYLSLYLVGLWDSPIALIG